MNEQTVTIPVRPAPLDPTVFHTRAEVRAWHAAEANYFSALQALERQKRAQEEAKRVEAQRALTDEEQDAENLRRYNAMKAKELELEAERFAARQAREDKLASGETTITLAENNPVDFLNGFAVLSVKGYAPDYEAMFSLGPHWFAMTMHRQQEPSKGARR